MEENIWWLCDGPAHMVSLEIEAIRVVESQEQVATNQLVDSVEEQHLLETLLEESKPALPEDTEGYHYLITTPFRYPPLKYGSRFGTRHRRGIFYASLAIPTALAECAYYRLLFWYGMAEPPPKGRLDTKQTTFSIEIQTTHGIRLDKAPFDRFRKTIAHPADYQATQQLGEMMREHNVAAFSYPSARDPHGGINLAVLQPAAIRSREPDGIKQWFCTTRATEVSFTELHTRSVGRRFLLDDFSHEGRLPGPACQYKI